MRFLSRQIVFPLLLCLYGLAVLPCRANDSLVVEYRLNQEEALKIEDYTDEPGKTLNEAINESKALSTHNRPKLDLNIQNVLKPYDHPEDANVLDLNLKDSDKSHQFTLTDLRIRALKNNLNIQVVKIDPDIAASELRKEEAKFDQIFYIYAKYKDSDLPTQSADNVSFKSSNPALDKQEVKLERLAQHANEFDVETGLKVPLRTGGTITLSTPIMNKRTSSTGNQFDTKDYQSALRFSISQPLLRNAGRDVSEASIRIASYEQQEASLNTRLQSIRIIAMVDKAYWKLYESWGQLDVRRQQYEYAQQNFEMVKSRVAEGLTARVEINRAEIGVADRLEALIVAETNLKLANRQLQFLLNEISDHATLDAIYLPSTLPNLVKYEINREKLFTDALSGRIELLIQELKLAADLTKIDYLENQTLPLFSIDYQYGALSNTFNNLGDSYRHVLDGDFNDWSVGLKFELPISNEANKARLARAVQQRSQRLTTKALQTLTIKREIYDAVDQIDQNWQRILAARQQVLIAGINYEAELKQFNEGLRTMTEVLETLSRLGEAQIKEIRAIGDYQVSLIDTAFATGTLLGYSKLDFPQ